jgi:hypothetical protein
MEANMKILDKTPFRTESGEIDIVGRVRGSLTHGLNWYDRIKAQDVVIAILEKVLGEKYVLVRNVTLTDTEIELPLVLVGPQGVFLIYVTHERGVFRAKDDEWGTVRGEKFVPASINLVKRTQKLGRVVQVYLERAGFKDLLVVDSILMSADPGTHIESTRPAVRIIMSDALERFAISINQGSVILSADVIYGIVKTILTGSPKKAEPASRATSATVTPSSGGRDTTDALFAGAQQQNAESLGFSYNEEQGAGQSSPRPTSQHQPVANQPAGRQNAEPQRAPSQNTGYQDSGFSGLESGREGFGNTDAPIFDSSGSNIPAFDTSQPYAQSGTEGSPKAPVRKKKGLFGMTAKQLGILVAILLFGLCGIAAFAAYFYLSLYG